MILVRLLSSKPTTDGDFRDLEFRFHRDVWHTDSGAQNPTPWQRNPAHTSQGGIPLPWRPNLVAFGATDALFPGKLSFGLKANIANSPPTLDITGYIPPNTPPNGDRPQTPLVGTSSPTGGSILPGTYQVVISASANGPVSQFVRAFVPPGTNTNTITVSGVTWTAAAAGPIGVFVGTDSQHMFDISSGGFWAGSVPDSFGNPTSFEISILPADGPGLPDLNFSALFFQAKPIVVGGVWEGPVIQKTLIGSHPTFKFAGASWTTNQWAGYILSDYTIKTALGPAGDRNFVVTSNGPDTLVIDGFHGTLPAVGDYCVLRPAAAHISSTTIGDDNFVNSLRPSGLVVDSLAGSLARIVRGTGAGYPPIPIASNTATTITLTREWYVPPDATSVWLVEAGTWVFTQHTDILHNDGTMGPTTLGSIPIVNFQGGALLIEAVAVNSDDDWSVEAYAPLRELYVPAQTSSTQQLILSVPGTLGIRSSAVPLVTLSAAGTARAVTAMVKTAPTGSDITAVVNIDGVPIATVTIADGTTAETTSISASIPGGDGTGAIPGVITLDITAVGSTFPGADLSVLIKF